MNGFDTHAAARKVKCLLELFLRQWKKKTTQLLFLKKVERQETKAFGERQTVCPAAAAAVSACESEPRGKESRDLTLTDAEARCEEG